MKNEMVKLFLVDDDIVFLKLLEMEFSQLQNFIIHTFVTGELCLANMNQQPDVVILDYHLDGVEKKAMNGIETLDKIKTMNADTPVIMLSAQDKIDVAIECIHHRAVDYVMKSETAFMHLQKIISHIFSAKKIEMELKWYMNRM